MRLVPLLILFIASPALAEKPNFLVISIDDLSDWIGCLKGHPQVKTPNLDALAKRGVNFTNAHCQAPLCNPSRTSVLTGLRPSTTGIYSLTPWFRTVPEFKDHVTLPQALMKHGYRTITTGKIWHAGYPPKESRAEEFTVFGFPGSPGPRPKVKFVTTPDPNPLVDWGVFPEKDELTDDAKVADYAIEQLKQKPKEPFALFAGFSRPHVPCYAPQKWFDLYPEETLQLPAVKDDDRDDLPRFASYLHWKLPEPRLKFLKDAKQWKPLVRAYLASISYVDHQIGRVLAALKENGLEEQTIVLLWSDHGWHLGEKGITGKNTLWERSTRVPLIVAGPGIATGNCSRSVELLDLYPTMVELCGAEKNPKLEGHSLLPQLRDPIAKREFPAITTHNQNNHAVRTEKWRYIRYVDGSEELYDCANDPHEWANLAGKVEFKNQIQELSKWLPKENAKAAPGSKARLLELIDGKPFWEGVEIDTKATLPDK
jgi:arylsulfatase A-like enzyme